MRIELAISGERVDAAGFRALACPATTAAASAACSRLAGASLDAAASISPEMLDRDLGGLGADGRHGPELVVDALARAIEGWLSGRLGEPGPATRDDRVAVAMSGGVDSAVAALLLAREGLDVIGVTMRLWHQGGALAERSCCAPETVRLARASAHAIGVPHVTLDVAERFRRGVVEDFVAGYAAGRTPNPCITCNGDVRFAILSEAARLLGAGRMASGHYARLDGTSGALAVARAHDDAKDQSYMLARLPARLLERLRFPLGGLTKDEVRRIAASAGLPAADAVESQEVCFVGADGYARFLEREAGIEPRLGAIVDSSGAVVGEHSGYWRFTVGQRKGLGLAGPEPRYVQAIDPALNRVVVGPAEELEVTMLALEDVVSRERIGESPLEVRLRYRGASARGIARAAGPRRLLLELSEPARAVAPGQTAALYRDDRLVAAGTIVAFPSSSESEVP